MPTLPGILVAAGPAQPQDLAAFTAARLRLARLRAHSNPPADVARWRDAGATAFILQLLSPLPGQAATTPQAFVDAYTDDLVAFLDQGLRYVELHDEPNRADRGCGVSWNDGAGFGVWFAEAAALLRARFGDALAIGFPALAPARPPCPEPAPLIEEAAFLDGCADALADADWAALHCYWADRAELRSYDGPLRFLRLYLERFPEQTFRITEFANVGVGATPLQQGQHYAEFLTAVSQYDAIAAACGFLLRSDHPAYAALGWLAPDGTPRETVTLVANRAAPPDSYRLRMLWPTEFRAYNQYFGENQELYTTSSGMVGGHNGVDLRVNRTAPENSPIRAALPGTVSQVAFDSTGYGHHLRVVSYGPEGEELTLIYAHLSHIDVSVGMVVNRGDVLGGAGSTGFSTGPHLHFGMRVTGLANPTVNDWFNPRPYLDSPARGFPREPYARTYVLLPPGADVTWAAAVVEGVWDAQRFTIGGSADDAGIGDLDLRRVVAVNPAGWGDDLAVFFETYYPGSLYVPVEAASPAQLRTSLQALPAMPDAPPPQPPRPKGLPREPYARTYVLLPPNAGAAWALAVARATWDRKRFTIGGSADDAGIGDLDARTVLAINPEAWGSDLRAFFAAHYPGVAYTAVCAESPEALEQQLGAL